MSTIPPSVPTRAMASAMRAAAGSRDEMLNSRWLPELLPLLKRNQADKQHAAVATVSL